jgi:hypothetical protein
MSLWSVFFALVLNVESEKLGLLEWWWLFIYSPNHYLSLPDCSVDGHTEQSGGALDIVLFTVWCVPRQPTIGVSSC